MKESWLMWIFVGLSCIGIAMLLGTFWYVGVICIIWGAIGAEYYLYKEIKIMKNQMAEKEAKK